MNQCRDVPGHIQAVWPTPLSIASPRDLAKFYSFIVQRRQGYATLATYKYKFGPKVDISIWGSHLTMQDHQHKECWLVPHIVLLC